MQVLNLQAQNYILPSKYGENIFTIAANCGLLGGRDWFYELKQDLSHLPYVIKQEHISAHCGIYMGNYH